MWSHVFLLLLFFLFALLHSTHELAVFACAVGCGRRIHFLEMLLRACVSKGRRGKFVLFWSGDQVFFWRCAFFVGDLGWKLTVNMTTCSCWLRASFLVSAISLLFLLELLDFLPGFDAVQYFIWFPLRPYKIIIFPVVVVTHRPPESGLQGCSHDSWIISSSNIIFIGCERCRWKLNLFYTIWF